jgi:hypothetical protein
MPELGIRVLMGGENQQRRAFSPGRNLKTLAQKAFPPLLLDLSKGGAPAIIRWSRRGQNKRKDGKAQKFVQVITIFVRNHSRPSFHGNSNRSRKENRILLSI